MNGDYLIAIIPCYEGFVKFKKDEEDENGLRLTCKFFWINETPIKELVVIGMDKYNNIYTTLGVTRLQLWRTVNKRKE